MSLLRNNIDHTKCLSRPDHWIGSILTFALIAGLFYASKNKVDVAEKLGTLLNNPKE